MKKVKVMLLSFSVLAVVGAALAFKARSEARFCYTLDLSGTKTSCSLLAGFKNDINNTTIYTTTSFDGGCFDEQSRALPCSGVTKSSTFN